MKKLLLFCFCVGSIAFSALSQNTTFMIRNTQNSMVLAWKGQESKRIILDAYGGNVNLINSSAIHSSYLFNGQEYDQNLNLYFYPSRMYSAFTKRFLQPDPKSQYHSPFSFVGGDPVNVIDKNGQEGKPLFLYEEIHGVPADANVNGGVLDFQAAVPDAHYYPLSDFVDGKVQNLSEWNGNVFVYGHMNAKENPMLELETADYRSDIKTSKNRSAQLVEYENDTYMVEIEPKELGVQLENVAKKNGVVLKNITTGGCEGGDIAQRIGMGVVEARGGEMLGQNIQTMGLRPGACGTMLGYNSTFVDEEVEGFSKFQYHISPKESQVVQNVVEAEEGGSEFLGIQNYKMPDGTALNPTYLEGAQINDFVNGRVPENLASNFKISNFKY